MNNIGIRANRKQYLFMLDTTVIFEIIEDNVLAIVINDYTSNIEVYTANNIENILNKYSLLF